MPQAAGSSCRRNKRCRTRAIGRLPQPIRTTDRNLFTAVPALQSRSYGRSRGHTRRTAVHGHLVMTLSKFRLPPILTPQFRHPGKGPPQRPVYDPKRRDSPAICTARRIRYLHILLKLWPTALPPAFFAGPRPLSHHWMPIGPVLSIRFSPIHF